MSERCTDRKGFEERIVPVGHDRRRKSRSRHSADFCRIPTEDTTPPGDKYSFIHIFTTATTAAAAAAAANMVPNDMYIREGCSLPLLLLPRGAKNTQVGQ